MDIQEKNKKSQKKRIGKYIVNQSKLLGEGSYAKVYAAYVESTKAPIAVKVLTKQLNAQEKRFKDALLYEIQISKVVKSPNIIQFIDAQESTNNIYIFQQLADTTLDKLLKAQEKKRFEEAKTIEYIGQLVNGFIQLCRLGIMHRDIKPSNILVKGDVLKISDFGLSRYSGSGNSIKSTKGSPAYMAPQLLYNLLNAKPCKYSEKCDIWSLGAVAYQLLTGALPWITNDTKNQKLLFDEVIQFAKGGIRFPPNIPVSQRMRDFIQGCLQYTQQQRFGWHDVFNHEIFAGKFKDKAMNLQNYLITELRIAIHSSNINLQKFLTKFPTNFTDQHFFVLISCLIESATENQAKNLFKILMSKENGSTTESILNFFEKNDIKVKGLIGKVLPNQEQKIKSMAKLQKKLIKGVEENKIDLFCIYEKLLGQDTTRIGKQEAMSVIRGICPDATLEQQEQFHKYFNPESSQKFFVTQFYEHLCEAVQVPCIKSKTIHEQLRKIQASQ